MPRITAMLGVLATAGTLAACGGGDDEGPLTSGSFVGSVPGTRAYVAVIVADARKGEGSRPVRVYVCDGGRVGEWFPGTIEGNEVTLASQSGRSRLELTLSHGRASGEVTLPEGKTAGFTAEPATGIAGLYELNIARDGAVRGTSDRGIRLEGRIDPDSGGRPPLTGDLIAADGSRHRFTSDFAPLPPYEGSGASRAIFLADGSSRGRTKPDADLSSGVWTGPTPI